MDKGLNDKLDEFFERRPEQSMSKSLIHVFIDFIRAQKEGEPVNMYSILNDMEALFTLLDLLEEANIKEGRRKRKK